ncbi:MAG: TolB family protein [Planctomycetaceae bacterium]
MKQITRDGILKLSPCILPGGREIVYSAHDIPNRVSLIRFQLDGEKSERVHPNITDHQFDAAWSADRRFHCFAMGSTSPQLVLVIKDSRDNTEKQFRPLDARATVRTPRFTPDGRRIVFALSDGGGQQIASVDLAGQDLKKLTASPGLNCHPSISPDGSKIAFCSSRDGHYQLYVMNADGGNVTRITESPSRDMRPAWSPDGTRIAFTSTRDGSHDIYVMQSDGSRPVRLTSDPDRDDFPIWHPDGREIVCVSERSGRHDLYSVDVPQ